MVNQELAEHWEDEYWEQVIKDSNLEAEIIQAEKRVVDCALLDYQARATLSPTCSIRDRARCALNGACRDLQALKGN